MAEIVKLEREERPSIAEIILALPGKSPEEVQHIIAAVHPRAESDDVLEKPCAKLIRWSEILVTNYYVAIT